MSGESTYVGRRLEIFFCGFILIFDNMSISQLEIDKCDLDLGAVQSKVRGQSTSVSHPLINVPNDYS